ncbi:hypothetical protein [Georgenia alba]|uniref:Uncharacterized protein n=1 Tax=Georgenia alba TaxID=2233858 RepID=A0ABW2Q1X6_9MICO
MDPSALIAVLMWPVLIGILVLLWWLRRKRTAQRRAALRTWAQARGWTYVGSAPELTRGLGRRPFGRGHSRSSTEAVRGTYEGHQAASWKYTYKRRRVSRGKRRTQRYDQHVISLWMPGRLPSVELRPEDAFTGTDTEFESAAFNDAWNVRGEDARTTSDIVHPRMMERLMRPDLKDANILIEDDRIILWRRGLPDPAAIDAALPVLLDLIGLIPRFVWDDARRGSG